MVPQEPTLGGGDFGDGSPKADSPTQVFFVYFGSSERVDAGLEEGFPRKSFFVLFSAHRTERPEVDGEESFQVRTPSVENILGLFIK